jgi:ABC-type sugar transport system permease subunit
MNRFVVALFLILFVFAGCNRKAIDLSAGSSNNTSATINHSVETQHAQAETIKRVNQENIEHTKTINAGVATSSTSANAISQKTEDPVIRANVNEIVTSNEKIHASADAIAANSQKIGESAQAIDTEATSIQKNVKSIVALEKKITELQDQKQKLENDAIKNLYTTLSFFFGLGFVTIVAGMVIAFLVNRKLGFSIAALGLLALAAAAGAIFYLKTIAIVAIVIIITAIVVCVGLGVWHLVNEVRAKTVLEQANVENVQLVQTIKDRLDPTAKVEIFGEVKKGLAHQLQSEKTQQIVQKVKKKIKSQGNVNEKL